MISSDISGLIIIKCEELNFFYESSKWEPTEEERKVMEVVWLQMKGECDKLKEETKDQNEHIKKMLKEMSNRYYS